jgi:sugar O-acyltransferase (sialic acid O-acetyltransferase NeuD family)
MADLVIFGAGDIARIAHFYFTHDTEHNVAAFVVDSQYREGNEFLGLPWLDFETITEKYPPDKFKMFVALSYANMNGVRESKCAQAENLGYELISYVSSKCTFLSEHPVGKNCFILEDNTIQPFVKIGQDVTLWSGNHIGHDSVIEDHVFITSHVVVSGNVRVGHHSFIGVNATLHNSVTLAPHTLVGAGAIIRKDTSEKDVWVPADSIVLKKKSDQVKM